VLVEVGADARVEGRELPVQLRVDQGAFLKILGIQGLELVLGADVAPDSMRLPAGEPGPADQRLAGGREVGRARLWNPGCA